MPAHAQGVSLTCPSVTGPGHCLLTVQDRQVFVRDLQSANGVHVERGGIFHRALAATEVLPDDIVHLGRPTVRLNWLA
jgi:pSer/pThr/pTyr-binding forkhead associated (FHA) protein